MDCTGIADLALYHLGVVTDDERSAVEAHLVECSACLRTYLAIKRAAERGDHERPRPEVRARLRAEVARAFPPREARAGVAGDTSSPAAPRPRLAVLGRRIPLYQGVALAAVAAAIALALPNVIHRAGRPDARPGAPSIDTSRTRAESLHIY